MTSNNDFYEALMDGRWRPDFELSESKDGYVAKYVQGDTVVERTSKWSVTDAESQLHDELRRGALEGEYYPLMS